MSGKTIRFEDLGEPVQRLLKSLKGGVSDEDMALLEFVSVKDMAKIYGEMSSDRQAAEIWEELRQALQLRREKAERKRTDLQNRSEALEDQRRKEEEAARQAEEQERLEREAEEEERRRRKEERRRRRAEESAAAAAAEEAAAEEEAAAAAAAAAAEQEAREEEERLAAEEADRKRREAKRKKREARARELQEEQEILAAEQAKSKKKTDQKKEWADYVASHPLEFTDNTPQVIDQVAVERATKAPPKISEDLLNRTYTPKCPNCNAKFSKPPNEWDCPLCLKRLRQRIKCWQPDDDTDKCMVCKGGIGRFSRHHCRNCGRLTCTKCCEHKALIPQVGFKDPVKICDDCARPAGVSAPVA